MTGDITTFRVGGEDIDVPPLTFGTLKRTFPKLQAAQESGVELDMISAMLAILSDALRKSRPELTPDEIEDRLKVTEMDGLRTSFEALLKASGFEQPKAAPGKGQPAASEPDSSTGTSTPSSSS